MRKPSKTTRWLDLGAIGEREVDIEYTFNRGFSGSLEEPPEPSGVDIQSVTYCGLDLTHLIDRDLLNDWEIDIGEEYLEGALE